MENVKAKNRQSENTSEEKKIIIFPTQFTTFAAG